MANEIELEIAAGGRVGEYAVRVIRAASGGEPRECLQLDVARILRMRPDLENAVLASAAHARGGPLPEVERPLREAGQELFEGLFTGAVRETYRASVAVAHERGAKLRVVLHLEAAELSGLPWEAMWDPEARAYLCRKEPLVRHVPAPYTPDPLPVTPPMRILGLVASPRGLPPLDVQRERRHLDDAVAPAVADGRIHVEWLESATWDSLQDRLLTRAWHVLHFVGHGDYDPELDQGRVALVGEEDGRADWVEAGRLVDLLNEAEPTPRLVVLNSCSSGQSGTQDVLSGTAAALVNSGISAVAAMQFRISDPAAVAFPRGFYKALAAGKSVDAALSSGRIAILGRGESLEWVTPVLYTRGDSLQLFSMSGVAAVTATEQVVRAAPQPPRVAAAGPDAEWARAAEELPWELGQDVHYKRAEEAYRLGDWDEAAALFGQVQADHPGVEIPHLESARKKREIASWWAGAVGERRTGAAGTAPVGTAPVGTPPPGAPVHGGGVPGTPPHTHVDAAAWPPPTQARAAGGPPIVHTGAAGTSPQAHPGAGGPAEPGQSPDHPEPSRGRRPSTAIATVLLLVLLGIAAAWLLTRGDGTTVTDGSTTETAVPSDSTSSTSPPPSAPATMAAPNLVTLIPPDQAAEVPLDGEAQIEVQVRNELADDRDVGPAEGGVLTVAVAGSGIQIVAGRPDCVSPDDGHMRCEFGRLEKDKTTSFWVTLHGAALGNFELQTWAQLRDGKEVASRRASSPWSSSRASCRTCAA